MTIIESFKATAIDRWPILSTVVAALAVTLLLPKLFEVIRISSFPVIGEELGGEEKRRLAYLAGSRRLYNDGYRKFRNGVFRMATSRASPVIVLAPEFLPELKKLPDTIISMDAAIDETMETKYTKMATTVPIIPHTVKAQLTPALVRLNPSIAEEVRVALDKEMPSCGDWTEVNINQKLLRIVGMVSGRVFIGPELAHTEEYLDAAINYTLDVMAAQQAVHKMNPWLRPFLAQSLPQVKKLYRRIDEADKFLQPIVKQRREVAADPSLEKPDDMLQWLVDGQGKFTDKNSQNLAKVQLGLSFAAIHTTTMTATNAFYNIAEMPQLAPEFREEIRQALAKNNGVFTSDALQSMKKMDSFLKETLRIHPGSMASFQRKVLQAFILSNGQVIPAGVTIEIPAVAISSDPSVFPNPDKFDALRFYRLRQDARESGAIETSALNQFVSVSQNSLTFGYGRHACPGRFFAANEIKMILANALMKYDIKNIEGISGRYPNIEFAHMSIPDPSKTLLFKAIAD